MTDADRALVACPRCHAPMRFSRLIQVASVGVTNEVYVCPACGRDHWVVPGKADEDRWQGWTDQQERTTAED